MASRTRPIASFLIRAALLVGALAFLWWAQRRQIAWRNDMAKFFTFSLGMWVSWVALLIVAGLLIGFSGLGSLHRGYRWGTALLISSPPALLLGQFVLVFGYGNDIGLPGALGRYTVFMDSQPQFALALMVGLGIAMGFRTSSVPPPAEPVARAAQET